MNRHGPKSDVFGASRARSADLSRERWWMAKIRARRQTDAAEKQAGITEQERYPLLTFHWPAAEVGFNDFFKKQQGEQ